MTEAKQHKMTGNEKQGPKNHNSLLEVMSLADPQNVLTELYKHMLREYIEAHKGSDGKYTGKYRYLEMYQYFAGTGLFSPPEARREYESPRQRFNKP